MVIDSSALIAIMLSESVSPRLISAIDQDAARLVSAGTVLETSFVLLGRYGERGESQLDPFLRSIGAQVIVVDEEQLAIARDAARTFGRGRHTAALNFGDCFSYALAIARRESLLFVGNDFAHTDVAVATW